MTLMEQGEHSLCISTAETQTKCFEEIKRLLSSIQLSGAFVATLRFGPPDDEKAVEHRQEFVLQIWWIAIWQIALSLYLESYCNMWVKIGNGFALI